MVIHGIEVDEEVLTTKFACDYEVCKGACCHISSDIAGYEGCLLTEDENILINQNKVLLSRLVTGEGHDMVLLEPTYTRKNEHFVSVMTNGQCCLECGGHCILNTARRMGLIDHGNPIGCGLYPLVLERKHLFIGHYYDDLHLCDCGYAKGEKEGIHLVKFCKDSLIRALGEEFYNELESMLR